MIPQCNPLASYHDAASGIDEAIRRVLTGGRYILGPEVGAFEEEFSAFLADGRTAGQAIGVANGTDAIELALRALDVGPGDVVITVSFSAVATVAAIRATGAVPLFADVTAEHGVMDPVSVRALIDELGLERKALKAIVPVHLYGHCADMDAIGAIAAAHRLAVVEDCAQAHGARWKGHMAGTLGDAGTFSFYPTKNLGALGDAGAVYATRAALGERIRLLRQYGWQERYVSAIEGGNSRLDELQAAVLRVKLPRLDQDNAARRALADIYLSGIAHRDVVVPRRDAGVRHAYHQFVVRTHGRDALRAHLQSAGVATLVHYPAAIHQQPGYADPSFRPLPLPRTERWANEVLSLPMFPQLAPEDAQRVVAAINAWDGSP